MSGDGIVSTKDTISSFHDLYGCGVGSLPVSREDRIEMHEKQAEKAKELGEKIYDRIKVLEKRLRKVNDARNWNALMVQDLKKGL